MVADRAGGKNFIKAQPSFWGDVQQAMESWAEDAAYKLCKLQKRGDCVPVPQQ
ncbi:hypothetical protein FAK_37980 [Desulfoferula mesophila]|uniref:Uncharacterized protein n=1 Tax=Desulfoferula mesophila TaxID=3058419 RepID=A0AAU9EJY0_9BACT|nr:hypothetical protein FAK_37980 [Desulfoferula mesophilus]